MLDEDLERALRRIADPCSIATGVPINLVDMGLVVRAERRGSTAHVVLQLTSTICMQIGIIEAKIREEFLEIPAVDAVDVQIDHHAEWLPTMIADHARIALRQRRPFSAGPTPVTIDAARRPG